MESKGEPKKRASLGENHQAEIINLTDTDRMNKSKANVDIANRSEKHPVKKAKQCAKGKYSVKPNLKVFYTNADQFPIRMTTSRCLLQVRIQIFY